MMLYEVHWGSNVIYNPTFLFNAHVGLGHASDFYNERDFFLFSYWS